MTFLVSHGSFFRSKRHPLIQFINGSVFLHQARSVSRLDSLIPLFVRVNFEFFFIAILALLVKTAEKLYRGTSGVRPVSP